jgi:hypothetical protein
MVSTKAKAGMRSAKRWSVSFFLTQLKSLFWWVVIQFVYITKQEMTVLKILWQEQETNTEIIFEVDCGTTKT